MPDTDNPVDFYKYLNKDTLDLLFDLMDGDSKLIIDLVDTLIDTTPKLLEELKEAVISKNSSKVRNTAHSLKSSNAQLGAVAFAALCEIMEAKARNGETEDLDLLLGKILAEYQLVNEALGSWKMSLS